jgi:hypothetical protein
MAIVYKYSCPPEPEFTMHLPQDAEIIHFSLQNNIPVFWVRCKIDMPLVDRKFLLLPTGVKHSKLDSISTVHVGSLNERVALDIYLALHLFEVTA